MTSFASIHHPGTSSLAYVVAAAQAQPVAWALVALLTASFVALMQGAPVLVTLAWASPLAYAAAAGWSIYEVRRKPAEIVIRDGFAAVRSVWEVARDPNPRADADLRLLRVFPPRRIDGELTVGIGHEVHTIRPAEWPQYTGLKRALRAASMAFSPAPAAAA